MNIASRYGSENPMAYALDSEQLLIEKIQTLKQKKQVLILAHYYQRPEIQDIADFVGDSLELARKAKDTKAQIILFAGVHFMAEGAKILNPKSKVLIPDMKAGCSLSDRCDPKDFSQFLESNPEHFVISYINCSAAIKAMSHVICTSSNAVKIVNRAPQNRPILFAPDKNLGAWVMKQTGRKMTLWNGSCIVHETFSERKLIELKTKHPRAQIIAHPECEEPLLAHAHFVGSTSALLKHTRDVKCSQFIVVTEEGILHQMKIASPEKEFIPAPPLANCNCNECPYMKLNTLEKIANTLEIESNEILLDNTIRKRAEIALERMLEWSN